ncbi:MAG: hypothetical protein AAF481_14250 [Acidobacteriota bacterium]
MEPLLSIAGILALGLGIVHSALGEVLLFRRMRRGRLVPSDGGTVLRARHVRILWATWHGLTVFGWAFGAILFRLATPGGASQGFVETVIAFAMLATSLLVLYGTKGRHPGWIVLLAIAFLVWVH